MLIPSIDLMGGQAVQLIGGKETAIEAGDPRPIAKKFALAGPMAVIDLDAALGQGDNAAIIEELCQEYRCRVGGGIRSLEVARKWLDAGAEHIIIGTAAEPEFLKELPRERVLAALDAYEDEVVVEGWRTRTGKSITEKMQELLPYVDGFLVTFVEREGRLGGTRLDRAEELVEACPGAKLTIAGGVTTAEEIRTLDAMGADAQVGMALYSGQLSFSEALMAPMRSDREDGLWPTVVVDNFDRALGLCYSSLESIEAAIASQSGVYWSRKRGLWRKGETSGATQRLLAIDMDCDRDTLRFKVEQSGDGFCHQKTRSCWGKLGGIPALAETLKERLESAPEGSYSKRLFNDPIMLASKLQEEAQELMDASTPEDVRWESADLLFFTLAAMTRGGSSLSDVARTLDQRALAITRRPGNIKSNQGSRELRS